MTYLEMTLKFMTMFILILTSIVYKLCLYVTYVCYVSIHPYVTYLCSVSIHPYVTYVCYMILFLFYAYALTHM